LSQFSRHGFGVVIFIEIAVAFLHNASLDFRADRSMLFVASHLQSHRAAVFEFGRTIAFSNAGVTRKARGTLGEVGYDSHHGSSDVRNLFIH
jgi:hypothetical protein